METIHIQKYIHTTPRKLRLVADMVRKMNPDEALNILRFADKSAAKDLEKAIKVAVSNAKVGGLQDAVFKSIEINEGPKMRRYHAGTRGRVKPFRRKMAHIKIVLTDNLNVKTQKSKIKTEAKKQVTKKGDKQTEVVMDKSAEKAE